MKLFLSLSLLLTCRILPPVFCDNSTRENLVEISPTDLNHYAYVVSVQAIECKVFPHVRDLCPAIVISESQVLMATECLFLNIAPKCTKMQIVVGMREGQIREVFTFTKFNTTPTWFQGATHSITVLTLDKTIDLKKHNIKSPLFLKSTTTTKGRFVGSNGTHIGTFNINFLSTEDCKNELETIGRVDLSEEVGVNLFCAENYTTDNLTMPHLGLGGFVETEENHILALISFTTMPREDQPLILCSIAKHMTFINAIAEENIEWI